MLNDDGLGAAMASAYNRDKAEQANKRLDALEADFKELMKAVHYLHNSLEDAYSRIDALENPNQ